MIQIAVVDDDESFARAIGRLLRASGFRTALYHTAEDFLQDAAAGQTGCLVADVQLGGMSGLDLGRRLAEKHSRIPVIYITAMESDEPCREARQLGCTDFLRKPVAGQVLVNAIRRAIETNQPCLNQSSK